jgi:hypothetical protein
VALLLSLDCQAVVLKGDTALEDKRITIISFFDILE